MGKGGQDEARRPDGSVSRGSDLDVPVFLFWVRAPSKCLAELGVAADRGLSSEDAAARLQRYGSNELERHAPPSVWMLVLERFNDTLVRILFAAAVVSFVLALCDGETAQKAVDLLPLHPTTSSNPAPLLLVASLFAHLEEENSPSSPTRRQLKNCNTYKCLMGRRRFLSKITAGNSREKAQARKQAFNSICQFSKHLSCFSC